MALFRNKPQNIIIILIPLFSFCLQKSFAQKTVLTTNGVELTLEPISIIIGEEYPGKLFVSINSENGKMGLFSENEKEVLPAIYDEVYSSIVNPHYIVVVEDRRKGLFDLKGNRICESNYDGFTVSPSDSSVFGAYIGHQEKWRVLDNKGNSVFSEDYTKVQFLQKDLVILQQEDLSSCLASIRGNLITDFKFQLLQGVQDNSPNIDWFNENDIVATAVSGLQTIYVNSKGEIVDR